jgi:hypothetical protein
MFCPHQELHQKGGAVGMVKGKLSLLRASPNHFRPFCKAYSDRDIEFLYKQTKDSLKVCAQSKIENVPFTLTFYDKKGKHMPGKIKGSTGSNMFQVPPKVFKEVGPEVNFKIEVDLSSLK